MDSHHPQTLAEGMTPSGRFAEKLSLPTLQSKMKCDPEGYLSELALVYGQFNSSVDLFKHQADMSFTSVSGIAADPTVAKNLGDRAMFLAHMRAFYPEELKEFPEKLRELLKKAKTLPSGLRVHLTHALILLINRKFVEVKDTVDLFIELQTLGDKILKKLAFSHVVNSIKRMNQKNKNDPKNREIQKIIFPILQKQEDEAKAKRSLITLNELHRRKVWFDEGTAIVICDACFHKSNRIMIAALSFLLDFENIEGGDSDDSDSEDDQKSQQPQVVVNKEAIYKANNKGTKSSKKKKQAKLQRVVRSLKKQQRTSSQNSNISYYSPLNHLKDAQGFVERLFSRLQSCNERFEVKMMLLKVIARTIGLHRLILLGFYPYIQRYVQPHQRDVTSLLAAAVQACHDMVPPEAVESLFRQVVNQFVHDKSRPEAISVGLNVVREICLRIPLLMTEDLLQDLVLYKKSKEKSVSSSARALLTLFREVCPSLLMKKDRGRPIDPKSKPKAFGEVNVASNVPGIELLEQEVDDSDNNMDDDVSLNSHNDNQNGDSNSMDDEDSNILNNDLSEGEDVSDDGEDEVDHQSDIDSEDFEDMSEDEYDSDSMNDADGDNNEVKDLDSTEEGFQGSSDDEFDGNSDEDSIKKSKAQKRKLSDVDGQLDAAGNSLRALKKLAGANMGNVSSEAEDGILSNEDFQRIRELEAKREARITLARHGFRVPNSDQLSSKRVNPSTLEVNIRRKQTKEEKLEVIRAEREERGQYKSRASIKKKKTGGQSNQEKQHKKIMPLGAKRHTIARNRLKNKIKKQRAGKQQRGRKAWK